MFFVRSLLVAVFALGSLSPLFAGGGDSFVGGFAGGLTGGVVSGAINKSGDSRSSREAEQLRRERDQEKMDEMRQKQSGDKFMLYVLFFVVFGLLFAVGALGFFVLRK